LVEVAQSFGLKSRVLRPDVSSSKGKGDMSELNDFNRQVMMVIRQALSSRLSMVRQ
jgi:hypothetical protein